MRNRCRRHDGDVPLVPNYLGGTEMSDIGVLQIACVALMLATTGVI